MTVHGIRARVQGLACLILLCALALPVSADGRFALIIGNSAYRDVADLANPRHDAHDLARTFQTLGYDVDLHTDLTRADFVTALGEFRRKSHGADHAVIYFAGHGMEIDRQNYLIPVDARLKSDIDVEYETIPLEMLSNAASGAGELSLVILDACRDNPFLNQMTRSTATRAIGRGLGRVEPNQNTLVAFAAKEGTVALDGNGRNSPYAAALMQVLAQPGVEINFVFREIHDLVLRNTGGQQRPHFYGALSSRRIYLNPPQATAARVDPAPAPAATPPAQPGGPSQLEVMLWEAAKRGNEQDMRDYLRRFPDGAYAHLATARLRGQGNTSLFQNKRPRARPENGAATGSDPVQPAAIPQVASLNLFDTPVTDLTRVRSFKGHTEGIYDVAVTPDGTRLVSGGRDGTIRVWDSQTGRQVALWAETGDPGKANNLVSSLAIDAAGGTVVSGSWGGRVTRWDLTRGKRLNVKALGSNAVAGLDVSADGRLTVVGQSNGRQAQVTVIDWDADRVLRQFQVRPSINTVQLSPDERFVLISGPERSVQEYDMATGTLRRSYQSPRGTPSAAAYSADGLRILAATVTRRSDQSVATALIAWDRTDGRETLLFDQPHDRVVDDIALSPDGRMLLTGSTDKTARLFDLSAQAALQTVKSHGSYVFATAFLADSSGFVTASIDRSLQLFQLPDAGLLAAIAQENGLALGQSGYVRVQQALNGQGYNVGAADGQPGRKTRAGIRAWQKDRGRQVTGYLTAADHAALTTAN